MENKLFRKKEILLLLIISALMLALMLLPSLKESGKGARAIVTCNGDVVAEIDLGKDADYTIEGALTATLEVRNGKIRFVHSLCPDKICEAFGWIGEPGETAICAPARIAVQIV